METIQRSEQHRKILEGMYIVYQKLIEFKKKSNSELVVLKNNQIVHIKP